LGEKFSVLTEQHSLVTKKKHELETKLTELQGDYVTKTTEMKETISHLADNIELLKTKTDSHTSELQNAKDELQKERDQIREELKHTKEKLAKEKEELSQQNEQLKANLRNNSKLKQELEEILASAEQNEAMSLDILRKHVLIHIRDLHTWKVYLEEDREFEPEKVKLTTDKQLEGKPFAEQVSLLDKALLEDNERLETLVKERELEAAEVVSVNIGKKKKRIKKNDPLMEKLDDVDEKKGSGLKSSRKERKKNMESQNQQGRERVKYPHVGKSRIKLSKVPVKLRGMLPQKRENNLFRNFSK